MTWVGPIDWRPAVCAALGCRRCPSWLGGLAGTWTQRRPHGMRSTCQSRLGFCRRSGGSGAGEPGRCQPRVVT